MALHPSLVYVCDWPPDPKDITHEHVLKLTERGDVQTVLADIARLVIAHPASLPEPAPISAA